jgi:pimeloyl-ACP methyl ester carboxylesterase
MKLSTRTVGSGSRTAALVHGASMSGDAWREFIPFLLEHDLTLIVVDLRGRARH